MTYAWLPSAIIVVLGGLGLHVFSRFAKDFPDPYFAGLIAHGVAFLVVLLIYFLFSDFNLSYKISNQDYMFAIMTGVCIGLANLFVMVMYKQNAPISIAMPATRLTVIVAGVLVGVFVFSESLTYLKILGIVMSVVSIVLLTA
jgi:uncharacterized membrane protein